MMVRGAEGVYVTDEDGVTYLDLSSQLVNTNVGHQHPAVVAGIVEQARRLCTIAPQHGYEARYRAAELILDRSFAGAAKVFFTNGGTEAVEHATRMARLHTGRPKVLSAYRSYHGATATSINLTGDPRRWPSDSGSAGVVHFFGPFLYRSAFHAADEAQECERALEHLTRWSTSRGRARSPPSSSRRSPAPPGSCSRPPATWPGCARCATATGS